MKSTVRKYLHCRQSINSLPEVSRHFPCLPEHGYRLIGLGVKQHAQWKLVRSRPARRHDDADHGPSLGNLMGQIRPAHRSGHAYIREKQLDVRVCFEESQGLVGVFGFENPVSCILEHAGCAHSLEHVIFDDQNDGVGGDFDHRRQRNLITTVPWLIRLSVNTV